MSANVSSKKMISSKTKPSSTESANLGSNSNMPNQYAKVKNVVKGEDNIQDNPPREEIMSLQQYCLTQGDTPWNPSTFTDQVADVFYKQVIDTESYNANSMK
jgi:hypothetical protein